jgi:hypothetical protein
MGVTAGDQLSDENLQTMSFYLTPTSGTNGILSASVATLTKPVGANATLTLTLAQYLNGDTEYTIYAQDDGGTVNGGINTSIISTFIVSILPVNNIPTFASAYTVANPVAVNEDAVLSPGYTTVVNFITSPSVGPNEAGQTFTFILSYVSGETSLFDSVPLVGVDGTLSMQLKRYMYGSAVYSVSVCVFFLSYLCMLCMCVEMHDFVSLLRETDVMVSVVLKGCMCIWTICVCVCVCVVKHECVCLIVA